MHVLTEIIERIGRTTGSRPLLLFDLDSTLFNSDLRSLTVLQQAATKHPALARIIRDWRPQDVGWFSIDRLRQLGLTDEAALADIARIWRENFFCNEMLEMDEPLAGATEFVRRTHQAGALVCFLTGRDRPGMEPGTRRTLAAHGLPLEPEGAALLMKPFFEMPDAEFKARALQQVRGLGRLVAAFDNEPYMVNLLHDEFPEAIVVLLDTIHSPTAIAPYPAVRRIPDFRLPD